MDYILELAKIIGWIYFLAWTVSFYPQIWTNYKRKSVVGLSFNLVFLNLTGFLFYSIFNALLFYVPTYQDAYHQYAPNSTIPVEIQDIFFAFHATLATMIVGIQCLIYESANQGVSVFVSLFTIFSWSIALFLTGLAVFHQISILFQAYYFSYIKLFVTTVKYIPQAWMNYTRKSTIGWSITNVLLDFLGGFLSIMQMFLIAYANDDWLNIFGNLTKLGLGLLTICFDLLFICQHYVLYRDSQSMTLNFIISESEPIYDQKNQV